MSERTDTSVSTGQLLRILSIRLALVAIFVGALLFGTAGSFSYWNAWLFMAALFFPMVVVSILLFRKDRALLEKRLRMREKEKEQKVYLKLSVLWFFISFAIPGLDYRFGWSEIPLWLVIVAVIVMVLSYVLVIVVMMQNRYASRVIEIQANQRVIDTGLYSIVRHPMYTAAAIMYAACPFVLGSYYGLIPTLLLPPLLMFRILNEEKVLQAGLPGYAEYAKRVRFRAVPYVW